MRSNQDEFENLKSALDNTILSGEHFTDKQKEDIREGIKKQRYSKNQFRSKSLVPRFLTIAFTILFISFVGILITNSMKDLNESAKETSPNEKKESTLAETKDTDIYDFPPALYGNTQTRLKVGEGYKGTGDLGVRVNKIRVVPSNEQETNNGLITIGVLIKVENRGSKELFISPEVTMKLFNDQMEEQIDIKNVESIKGPLEVSESKSGELLFEIPKAKKYKFIYLDKEGKMFIEWYFPE
ncbi:DUF4352 domain-containing protein [Heyndrickxia oleronia]|jgi:hypothetical protein|uniref:DUF4352 domain-containing protein n=1 Tax=Heyndrickxia oleronia TaxID=38875 RepID=A0A8E2I6F5_9BACI|nr:DUF4352 domain-containing protein [Heyndrickxia oleronia]MCI1591063.1 DUF4352 domain-containing protein [Heyndrickxia oleronia]MCI1613122.1 DUF4352 domain-containing protein [Heyndrickxia oleronia]MCI1760988.1 DUF4352 domain-containing protein [Heyndrickxia oleronia]MEC1375326.1 DUF4352 domain-containing protein [Heyndrickxia oleronia]OOP65719.1 hypothetical protein BWZ43_24700 [Heyndrickxia oleronia]